MEKGQKGVPLAPSKKVANRGLRIGKKKHPEEGRKSEGSQKVGAKP